MEKGSREKGELGKKSSSEAQTALQAYRREIAQLKAKLKEEKEHFEGCNTERLEALNRAGLLEMELKVLRRESQQPGISSDAITLLKDAVKLKNPTVRRLKTAMREFLTKIGSSSDSPKASQ